MATTPPSAMDKTELRAAIKLCWVIGLTATKTKSELDAVLRASSPPQSTVTFCISEFKRERTNTEGEARFGRSKTASTAENAGKIVKKSSPTLGFWFAT